MSGNAYGGAIYSTHVFSLDSQSEFHSHLVTPADASVFSGGVTVFAQ